MTWNCQGLTKNGEEGCGRVNDDFDTICLNCGLSKIELGILSLEETKSVKEKKQTASSKFNKKGKKGKIPAVSTKVLIRAAILLFLGITGFFIFPFIRNNVPKLSIINPVPEEKWHTYTNEKYGIQINYSENWKLDQTKHIITGQIARFLPSNPTKNNFNESKSFIASVTISVENLSNNPMSLNEYSRSLINQINRESGLKIEPLPDILANQRAEKIIYTTTKENKEVKIMSIWTLNNYIAYQITYVAEEQQYSQFEEIVTEMVKSLQIKSNN